MFKYIRILGIMLIFALISAFIYKYRRQVPSPSLIVETILPAPTTISKNGLPSKHLIKTTFIPQSPDKNWDQPWQDACEEAALLTLHFYYSPQDYHSGDLKTAYQQLFDFEAQQNWTHDINLTQMAYISDKLWSYHSQIIANPSLNDLKKYLAQDIPIITPSNGKILYQENKHFSHGGPWYHNLVILGYDDTRQQFTVHDVGTQFGAYFTYSYPTLMASIHDFPDSKNKEDINQATPKVLILLK